jgi:hypothetical protein
MQSEDFDSSRRKREGTALPAVAPLQLITLQEPEPQQRRRAPRRRTFAQFLIERRRADRRTAKPGIDGLLRMVLADDWEQSDNLTI